MCGPRPSQFSKSKLQLNKLEPRNSLLFIHIQPALPCHSGQRISKRKSMITSNSLLLQLHFKLVEHSSKKTGIKAGAIPPQTSRRYKLNSVERTARKHTTFSLVPNTSTSQKGTSIKPIQGQHGRSHPHLSPTKQYRQLGAALRTQQWRRGSCGSQTWP